MELTNKRKIVTLLISIFLIFFIAIFSSTTINATENKPSTSTNNISNSSPELIDIKNVAKGVQINFKNINGAASYKIFKLIGNKWKEIGVSKTTSFIDSKDLKANTKYSYTVRGVDKNNKFVGEYDKNGLSIIWYPMVSTPQISNESVGQKVSWTKIPGVKYYGVLSRKDKDNEWSLISLTTNNKFTNKKVKNNVAYQYLVIPFHSNTELVNSEYKNIAKKVFLSTPKLKSSANVYGGQKISWESIPGVYKYRVFYRTSTTGKWKNIGETSKTDGINKKAENNKPAYYAVRGIDKNGSFVTGYTSYKAKTYFKTPEMLSAYPSGTAMHVKWEAIQGVEKYRVYYKQKDKDSNWVVLGVVDGNEINHDELSDGKEYCYTVRCVDTNNKNISGYTSGISNKYSKTQKINASSKVLVQIANPDPNYRSGSYKELMGRELTDAERDIIINTVNGEFGCDYLGSVYIAQCIRDALVYGYVTSPLTLPYEFGYDGYEVSNHSYTQNAIDAVHYVFDEGGSGVQHRMLVMYNPTMCSSLWHESQNLIVDYPGYWGTVRFFDFW